MSPEARCPNCGAALPDPRQPCPFCAEAQRLLQRLTEKDEVRLCTRCGALLEADEDDLCAACSKVASAPPSLWRREDRLAGWIRDRFVEPVAERQGIACPSCGAAASPLAIFCSQCGYRLAGDRVEAAILPPSRGAKAAAETAGPGVLLAAAGTESGPVAGPESGEPIPTEAVTAPPRPSWWESVVAFWKDQFRPRGPAIEQPAIPWWKRVWKVIRGLLGLDPGARKVQAWLWVVLTALLVGLVAMFYFWGTLLRSGGVVFR